MPKAILFDAYGTLFDVHSVVRGVDNVPGDLAALSRLWREKQVEYTWRRALMAQYADFWQVTREALCWAAERLVIKMPEQTLDRLMQAYLSPSIFADVKPGLSALKSVPLAILSNGSPAMLQAAVKANRLEDCFERVISVDEIRTYKPTPAVYHLGTAAFGARADEILFVSSNAWDICGASAFGYKTCWCSRSGEIKDCLGFDPDIVVNGLDQIVSAPGFANIS